MSDSNCVTIDGKQYFHNRRFFVSFLGIDLPLRLVSEIEPSAIRNRNTYFIAYYDKNGLLIRCDKMVYGEIAVSHSYEYYVSGVLKSATLRSDDDEGKTIFFDEEGKSRGPDMLRTGKFAN